MLSLKFQFIWRTATEIFHHHPNSTMEDYNTIYERMKHSGFRHYLMVLQLIKVAAVQFSCESAYFFSYEVLSFCVSRFLWNIPSTFCSTSRLKMQSGILLALRVGGTGKRQQLRFRILNWSRRTGACWIISSGVTKSPHAPAAVRQHAA